MSSVTDAYIINKDAFQKACNPVPENSTSLPCGCGPRIAYTCRMNTTDFWKKAASSNNEIVSQNITEGGFICDFKPRSDINDRMCGRFVVNPVRPPFEETAEVGFYLRHGENSRCVKEFVKRHSNIGM